MAFIKGKRLLKIGLLISLVFVLGITIGVGRSQKVPTSSESAYEDLKLFTDVLGILQKEYVDRPKQKELVYGAIKGMLETLDPHSAFMPPETYREMQDETKGRFEGIGIEITLKDSVLTVVSPIEDTPAFKVGLQAGDQIIKIENEVTKNMSLMDAVKRLRGPRGTKVTLSIMREGSNKVQEFTLVRDVIPVRSVRYELLDKQYGYIRLSQFQEKTDADLDKAIKSLETDSKGSLKGLILDLRNNPGGLLTQAVNVTDRFIDSGVIVSMEGRRDETKQKWYAHTAGTVNYPLVVLINGGSASASEIVAGAIQDHKRGVLVGTQSFGKGSVQTIFPLKEGAGLRLTTARYFTPSGRSIQAKGITPDILVKLARPEDETVNAPKMPSERDLERHLTEPGAPPPAKEKEKPKKEEIKKEDTKKDDSKKEDVKAKKPADNQLDIALDILKSWSIFKTNTARVK
jgi:carboxyl-terminal processing protease